MYPDANHEMGFIHDIDSVVHSEAIHDFQEHLHHILALVVGVVVQQNLVQWWLDRLVSAQHFRHNQYFNHNQYF